MKHMNLLSIFPMSFHQPSHICDMISCTLRLPVVRLIYRKFSFHCALHPYCFEQYLTCLKYHCYWHLFLKMGRPYEYRAPPITQPLSCRPYPVAQRRYSFTRLIFFRFWSSLSDPGALLSLSCRMAHSTSLSKFSTSYAELSAYNQFSFRLKKL
jgi:hypothetical protein